MRDDYSLDDIRRMPLLIPAEAAAVLRIKTQTLAKARCVSYTNNPYLMIPIVRMGRRIFYRGSDLADFIEANRLAGNKK